MQHDQGVAMTANGRLRLRSYSNGGLGQDGGSDTPDWLTALTTITGAAGKAYQQTVQADLQSQILQQQMLARGYTLSPSGQLVPPTSLLAVGTSSMMPLLLIGGVLIVVMMAARR